MQKVIGVIPARYGSTRFPGKILADILGKSLIRCTYENAKKCKAIDSLVVATDDPRIFDHVRSFGGQVFMTSLDCLTGTDRIAEVIRTHFPEYELILNIQGDQPCLDPTIADQVVRDLQQNPHYVMATAATRLDKEEEIFSPSVVKCVFDSKGRALYFSRAPIPYPQKGANKIYYKHLGVYCYRREFLLHYAALKPTPLQQCEDLEQLKVLEEGYPLFVSLVHSAGSVEVDTPKDIKRVEEWLCAENISLSQAESSPR